LALIGNRSVLNKSHAFFTNGTATAGAFAANNKANWVNPSYFSQRRFSVAPKTSFTEGHNLTDAYLGPWKSGGLASQVIEGVGSFTATALRVKLSEATLTGSSDVAAALGSIVQGLASLSGSGSISTATIQAVSSIASSLAGTSSISTANLSALVPLASTLEGSGSITSNLKGFGAMSATIEIGAAVGLSASDVWNYDISGINTAGTAGDALNNASSAGNPWSAELVDNNDPGTFGWFVQKLLTVAKFLGLK
jgi:hypothetical protein